MNLNIGIFLCGLGIMDGGEISGFSGGGIIIMAREEYVGELEFNNGSITNTGDRGGAINNVGITTLNGGTISENVLGILNSGELNMNDGEIILNVNGVKNRNNDPISGAQYTPAANLHGGAIKDNSGYAITNVQRGTVTIGGDMYVSGQFKSAVRFSTRAAASSKYIIRNAEEATLRIEGGLIESNVDNEIAVLNTDGGILQMTGGTIIEITKLKAIMWFARPAETMSVREIFFVPLKV